MSGHGGARTAGICHSAGGDAETEYTEPGAPSPGNFFFPQLLNLPSCLSSEHESCRFQLASLQAKQQEAQNLNHEQQNLKTRLSELETERTKANEQVPQ